MADEPTTRAWLAGYSQFRSDKLRGGTLRTLRHDRNAWVASITQTLERAGLDTRAKVLDHQQTDKVFKTLEFSNKKHASWLNLVIMDMRRINPAREALAARGLDASTAAPRVGAAAAPAAELPEVTAVRSRYLMDLLKADGSKKHKRFFCIDPERGTLNWVPSVKSRGEGEVPGKTETLREVTGAVTTWSHTKDKVLPARYVDRTFVIDTEEGTRLMIVAKDAQDKATWVAACQAVLAGDLTQPSLAGSSAYQATVMELAGATTTAWTSGKNGYRLAIGFHDATVALVDHNPRTDRWLAGDLPTLAPTLTGHSDTISSVCWSPDGSLLAIGSWDCTVSFIDTATWQVVMKERCHSDVITTMSWSDDGTKLAIGSADETVSLIVVQGGQVSPGGKKVVREDAVSALSFSADGTKLAIGSDDTSVCVCNTMSWEVVQEFDGLHTGTIVALSWEPVGMKRLAIASSDGTASVVDTRSGTLLGSKHASHVPLPGQQPDQSSQIEGVHDKVLMSLTWNSDSDCSFVMDAPHMPVLLEHVGATDESVATQLAVAAATPPPSMATTSNRRFAMNDDDDDVHWSDQPVQEWLESNAKFRSDKLRSRTDHVEKIVEALNIAAIYTVGDLIAHSRKDVKLTALKLSSKTGGEKRAWLRELVEMQTQESPKIHLSPNTKSLNSSVGAAMAAQRLSVGRQDGGGSSSMRQPDLSSALLGPL